MITWFLVGGDLYTAYTFIAVPALAFGAGAIAFFAVPYTILVYPILFVVFPRLWYVSHKHGYITLADFVRGRFGNRWLALAVTITGIVATMPYIALQLVGLQVVIGALGIGGKGMMGDAPLIIAFLPLARRPAAQPLPPAPCPAHSRSRKTALASLRRESQSCHSVNLRKARGRKRKHVSGGSTG